MLKLFLLLLFIANNTLAQDFIFNYEFGDFSQAASFSYNPSGYFYISDVSRDEIYKTDTFGKIIDEIGGYGWNNLEFDNPVDVFSTALNVYISDKNNHRIQIYDKDLNFLAEFKQRIDGNDNSRNREINFGFPLSSAVSSAGDLFILDSENKRILKFDLTGNYLLQIGAYDAGEYYLSNPKRFAISGDNKILVVDNDEIVIFDQYGSGLARIPMDFSVENINVYYNLLTLNNNEKIYWADLSASEVKIQEISLISENLENIQECIIIKDELFVLTNKNISVFKKKKKG